MFSWLVFHLNLDVEPTGEGMACGGLPIPFTCFAVPDVGNIYLIWND